MHGAIELEWSSVWSAGSHLADLAVGASGTELTQDGGVNHYLVVMRSQIRLT